MPLVATVAYIPAIFSSSVTAGARFIYILCILSLSTTAYVMKFGAFDSKVSRSGEPGVLAVQERKLDPRSYLFYANAAVCALLSLQSWYTSNNQGHDDHREFILGILPGGRLSYSIRKDPHGLLSIVVLGVVVMASRSLIEVDIGELEKLKYEYKGA